MRVSSVWIYFDRFGIKKAVQRTRGLVAILLAAVCGSLPAQTYAQNGGVPLGITVVQGEGGLIDGKHMVDIVVRVTAAGASVTFRLPASSGVSFPGGASQVTVKSSAEGLARSGMLSPAGKGGSFEVAVEATYMGQTAMAVVHETNGSLESANPKPHKSHAMVWVAIVAAGAAGGILAATKKGGSGGASPAAPSVSVTVGNPTVGAPQ